MAESMIVTGSTPASMLPVAGDKIQELVTSAYQMWQYQDQKKFQRSMRDTAWQAQVKDMRAAGVNPIYAMPGGGAASPQGSSISPSSSRGMTEGYLETRKNAPQRRLLMNQARAADAQADASSAAAAQANTQSYLNIKGLDRMDAEIQNLNAQTSYASAQSAREIIENYKRRATRGIYKIPYLGPALGAARELLGKW